jgi:hypothetical protein
MGRIREVHEFIKFIARSTKPRTKPRGSLMRMSPRMKFVHGFMEYIHDFGMTELLLEDLEAEKRKEFEFKKPVRAKQKNLA